MAYLQRGQTLESALYTFNFSLHRTFPLPETVELALRHLRLIHDLLALLKYELRSFLVQLGQLLFQSELSLLVARDFLSGALLPLQHYFQPVLILPERVLLQS